MAAAASTSNTPPMSWCDLPSDLFSQILRRLPTCKEVVPLSEVCHHWRVCARQHFPCRCQALPMRVTRTARGTHVVHVRGFSTLQEQHLPQCQPSRSPAKPWCVDGFLDSPAFAVGGLDWAIRYYPGSDYGGDGRVGVLIRLLTRGAVASAAHVRLQLLNQATGLADEVIWDQWYTRFDAACAKLCTRGTGKLATRSDLKGSGFIRGDCLKIECVIDDVCRYRRLK